MTDYGINPENLLRVFPPALKNDETMLALAAVIAEKMGAYPEHTNLPQLYTRIDRLPEALLNILAYDFKVDWWDADYTLEEKRQTLKDSWYVHRHLGTKAAVETAISAVYQNSKVEEWFEYGGAPYTFRLTIGISETGTTGEKQARVLERVKFYKNLRSHLDVIDYRIENSGRITVGGYFETGVYIDILPALVKDIVSIGETKTGGAVQMGQYIEINT